MLKSRFHYMIKFDDANFPPYLLLDFKYYKTYHQANIFA